MTKHLSPQEEIQKFMSEVIKLGNYETAYLFSEEGLNLAHKTNEEIVPEDRLVEMSVLFQEIHRMADVMGGISDIKELVVEGNNQRKIIFRFFHAFDQNVVLALVIPPRKTYRGLTNKLIRLVQKISD
ncbi:hypothetical protein B6I21_01965 [candidate division KSB1 bacterium 4572_119]|nr:MAG: hypothetical protein B6I21_01965 [candidate division KSB1 bacterium 4572_119]